MSKSLLLMFCIVTGLLVLACAKTEETNRNGVAPSSTPAANAASPTATVTASNAIGIAECDDFITAYENCVSTKVPEAGRAAMRDSLIRWRAEWKKAADNPTTRGQLAATCKTTLETTRAQFKAYGCTF